MSDTQYKKTTPGTQLSPASSLDLSYPSELLRPPAERMALAQDSILGGRRTLLSRHTGGSHEFLVDNTATGGGSQGKPDAVTWRRTAFARLEQQPGTALLVRFLYAPSGASEFNAGGTWDLSGVGGMTRVTAQWDTGTATANATVERTLDGEDDADGAEKQDPGAQWGQLQHQVAPLMLPPGAVNDFSVAEDYSEWPTVTLAVEDKGGARVLHMSVGEVPSDHTALHTTTDPTFTASAPAWETDRPQIEAPDGATYEEHRYGIFRSMEIAAKQTERVGPVIGQWSAYDERAAGPTDTDVAPRTTTAATFSRISAGLNTAWDTNEVGPFIMGTLRAPEHLSTRITGAGSVPVLIRVEARFSAAGVAIGVCRFASTDRSYVDVVVDQAVVGSTWTTVSAHGTLEASIASDDFWPVLQDFFRSDGAAQLEVRSWTVSYGDYTTGA
jgi:hypothetical protein